MTVYNNFCGNRLTFPINIYNRFSLAPALQLQQPAFVEQTLAGRRTLLSTAQRLRRPRQLLPRRRRQSRFHRHQRQQHPSAQRSESTSVATDGHRYDVERRLRRLWKLRAEQVYNSVRIESGFDDT